MAALTRRGALTALGGGLLAAACGESRRSLTGPEATGGEILSLNVHPLGGRFETLQREAIRRLAPPWIRVTLGLVTDTGAARPYLRLGPQVLGVVSDLRPGPLDAREWPDLLETVLRRYPHIARAELLNEPERFYGLAPARYVREFLRPGYERIRERFPWIAVVAAAPVGDRRAAPDRFRRLTDAGADDACDFRAVHVYFDDDGALAAIRGATRRPILVTETGSSVPGRHLAWYGGAVPRIRSAFGGEPVFWYVLLESADLAGGTVGYGYVGSSLIAAAPDAAGQPQVAPGSGLYPVLAGRTAERRR